MVWSRLQGYHLAQFQRNYTVIVYVNGLLCAVLSLLCHTQQPCVPASPGSSLALQAPYKTEEVGLAGPKRSTEAQGAQRGSITTSHCPHSGLLPAPKTLTPRPGHRFLRVTHLFSCNLFSCGFRQGIPPHCASGSCSVKWSRNSASFVGSL